jgi:regulator of PEP synthase PpsR (kinase-PPPase family)
MQFGIRSANYPIIPEDLERDQLPGTLASYRDKIFGLTIAPDRLHRIRSERRPDSKYASLENCRQETRQAEDLMRREGINVLDSTSRSVEEISSLIVQQLSMRDAKREVGY